MQRISFVGMGRVGLCTAVCFASKGYKTILSTHDGTKAEMVRSGVSPFYEPHAEQLLQKAIREGHLDVSLERDKAVLNSEITFITVGTPSKADGSIDLEFVCKSAEEIGRALRKKSDYHLVVVKSTVVPGTTEGMIKPLLEKHSGKKCGVSFSLCVNPEFLREGSAINDTLYPDRIVLGEFDKKSGDLMECLNKEFYGRDHPPIIRTNLSPAEFIKYANNAFLGTKISFINQIANICKRVQGVDVRTVAEGIGLDRRINSSFLNAGLGYGGSCLPKDIKALIAFSRKLGYAPQMLEAINNVNETQPYEAVTIAENLVGDLHNKRIAVLGLAFKPETDDMREAVSTKVVNKLLENGADVAVYDPVAMDNAKKIFSNRVEYASSAIECIRGADCCIIATEWEDFKKLEPGDFVKNMRTPTVVDGRRIYNPVEYRSKLKYAAIGLG